MHAHDVPAWAGGSAQQKPPDNPFQAPKPDGPNPFATARPEGTDNPFATASRPEGTDNPFATASRPEGTDNPFATRSVGDAPAPITASKQAAAPAARPAPPPSRPWKGCCGITPWQGCIGCVCVGMSCSFIGAFVYRAGHWAVFGVIFSLDAIASIGAMVFLSGPRKYCSGIFTNGPGRALLGLTYWGCILLTIGLCFIPANAYLIMLCIGVQKLFWALNLAASCGCLCTAATAPSTEKASGARAQTAAGPRSTAEIELVPKAL